MMRRIQGLFIALIAISIGFMSLPARAQSGRTFYIDYASGSNSNNGTSKATPWKTHPYMQTGSSCTGTGSAPAYTHQAGDRFIFKGGVTWPAGCFEMSIPDGGTSSATDYYGVDTSWYAGSSWSRPLFDLNYQVPTGNHVIAVTSVFPGYTTFDNLEIVHQGLTLGTYASDDAFNFNNVSGSMPSVLIENCYMHDWATNTNVAAQSSTYQWPYSAGAIFDGHDRVTVDHVTVSDAGGYVYNGTTKVTGGFSGGCVNCREVKNSVFHDDGAGCFTVLGGGCHDNEFYDYNAQKIYDICPCQPHEQIIEDDFYGVDGGSLVYNNYIHDNDRYDNGTGGVTIYVTYNSRVYNNVVSNNWNTQVMMRFYPGQSSSDVGQFFDNTIDCSNGTACIGFDRKTGSQNVPGTVYVQNNLFITNGSPTCFGNGCGYAATQYIDHNYTMSTSEASSYGFTSANKYKSYSADSNVTQKGLNLTEACGGNLSSLCQDTSGSPWFGEGYVPRSTGGIAWDLGAYVMGGQSASPPNPPTGLSASVN
jgi:hypothetical protein